jgi:hypothetical protein
MGKSPPCITSIGNLLAPDLEAAGNRSRMGLHPQHCDGSAAYIADVAQENVVGDPPAAARRRARRGPDFSGRIATSTLSPARLRRSRDDIERDRRRRSICRRRSQLRAPAPAPGSPTHEIRDHAVRGWA